MYLIFRLINDTLTGMSGWTLSRYSITFENVPKECRGQNPSGFEKAKNSFEIISSKLYNKLYNISLNGIIGDYKAVIYKKKKLVSQQCTLQNVSIFMPKRQSRKNSLSWTFLRIFKSKVRMYRFWWTTLFAAFDL